MTIQVGLPLSAHGVWTWSIHTFAHTSARASKVLNLSDRRVCVSIKEVGGSEGRGLGQVSGPTGPQTQECVPCHPEWLCPHRGTGSHLPTEDLVSGDQAELLSVVGDMEGPNSAAWLLTGQRDRIPMQITLVKATALITTIPSLCQYWGRGFREIQSRLGGFGGSRLREDSL